MTEDENSGWADKVITTGRDGCLEMTDDDGDKVKEIERATMTSVEEITQPVA